jgi:hypothetical protein
MMSLETNDVSGEKRCENIDSIEDENAREKPNSLFES